MLPRKIIGLVEKILVTGPDRSIMLRAKMDTGSERSSVDSKIADRLGLGPVVRYVRIRTSATDSPVKRPVVKARIRLAGEQFTVHLGVTDRSRLRYRAIVGNDVLASGRFLIDPTKPPPPPSPPK